MSRKSFLLAIAIVVLMVGGVGAGLIRLLHHEPAFYKRVSVPPGEERVNWSGDFQGKFTNQVLAHVLSETAWATDFTENEINSYFVEEFVRGHSAENPLPPGVSEPRVSLEADRIRLGYRYGTGFFSTIVSIDIRPWVVLREPNVIALEFVAMHAGAVPISGQWLLDRLAEAASKSHIDVSYYRYNKHPVVMLRFQSNRTHPTFRLGDLQIADGVLHVSGQPIGRGRTAE